MSDLTHPVAFMYWIVTVGIFIITWGALLLSILQFNEKDRETSRRVFLGGVLTLVMLSMVCWTLHTQIDIQMIPVKAEKN